MNQMFSLELYLAVLLLMGLKSWRIQNLKHDTHKFKNWIGINDWIRSKKESVQKFNHFQKEIFEQAFQMLNY